MAAGPSAGCSEADHRQGRNQGSLKTSNGAEAKRRVRIERIKVEAELDDARATLERQRAAVGGAPAAQITLTQEQVAGASLSAFTTAMARSMRESRRLPG